MVVHHLFVEHTAQVSEWRVIEVQQRLIQSEVLQASSMKDLENSELLSAWFMQLEKQSEASRCIHYLFRQKYDVVDFNHLSWHNLQKVYQKFK